jgi:aryl-alcohol dehydrogenase-like predicted oxidoreductase
MVLGTANFGNKYGVLQAKRSAPLLNRETTSIMLSETSRFGINAIDTALSYGSSQTWIANHNLANTFEVFSKIEWRGLSNLEEMTQDLNDVSQTFAVCRKLSILWHNWDFNSLDIEDFLFVHRDFSSRLSNPVGISTYGAENVRRALQLSVFDYLQIEFNILNPHALIAYFHSNHSNRPQLLLRSIFLQGLLTNRAFEMMDAEHSLFQFLLRIKEVADDYGLSIEEIALRWIYNYLSDARLVLGFDDVNHINLANQFLEKGPLPRDVTTQLSNLELPSLTHVDPRNWVSDE